MKTYGHIAFLMVWACLTACTHGVVETRHGTSLRTATLSPALSSVDSLIWVQPDSALACLLPYFDTCCRDAKFCVSTSTEYNRHYAHILLSELLYKNYYAQTNRTDLLDAVKYFDSLCDAARHVSTYVAFLDARAHYINGVGFYEHDSVVPACQEYMKALEVMDGRFMEEDLVGEKAKFMALTHTHLSSIYFDTYLPEQALYFGKLSLKYYQKYDAEPWHIAWMMNLIGSRFEILENYDSAYFYYSQGLALLTDTNTVMNRDISIGLARISPRMGGSLSTSLDQMRQILNCAESETEYEARCFSIGSMFYNEKLFDSAWFYLTIVYDKTQRVDMKKEAAQCLIEICEAQGKYEKSSEYARYLAPFATMEENQNSTMKSQLAELYNAYKQQQLRQQQRDETKKHAKLSIILFAGLLLVVIAAIIFLHKKNKQQKQNLETQIEAERHSHQMQQAALAGRLKRSNAALKEHNTSNTHMVPPSVSTQAVADNFADEPVCQHILATCNDKSNPIKSTVPVEAYASIALSDNKKAELKDAALRHYGQLFEMLKRCYPELKEKDFLYCQLCLLGLDNAQIAVLLQKSISTIWDRENRLKKILGSEDKVSVTLHGLMLS